MTEISFYHLTSSSLEIALPRLMEKVYTSGKRAILLAKTEEKAEEFNRILWTYHPNRFVPHGTVRDGNSGDQPIFITASHGHENPNGAEILVITEGHEQDNFANFNRVLDIFDGNDKEMLENARQRWKKYKAQEHSLSYFQQDEKGKWEKTEV